jgi:hypothetical protein
MGGIVDEEIIGDAAAEAVAPALRVEAEQMIAKRRHVGGPKAANRIVKCGIQISSPGFYGGPYARPPDANLMVHRNMRCKSEGLVKAAAKCRR